MPSRLSLNIIKLGTQSNMESELSMVWKFVQMMGDFFFLNLEHPECPLEKANQADYWVSLVKEHGQRKAICPGCIQTLEDTKGGRCGQEGAYSLEAYAAGRQPQSPAGGRVPWH